MPSPRSILTKLRPATAAPYMRRIIRWYLAPSGLLLAAALGLLLIASLGLGPSRVFAFVGVALMAIFLPYRFSRQQGLVLDRASEIEAQSLRIKRQLSRRVEAQSTRSQKELASAKAEMAGTQSKSQAALSRDVSDKLEIARIRTECIGREVDVLQTQSAWANARLEDLSDSVVAATQAIVAGLDDRVRSLAQGQQELLERQQTLIEREQQLSEQLASTLTQIESLVDDTNYDQDGPTDASPLIAEAVGGLRSDIALWAASTASQSFSGVALLVSPERSGTTWAFDVLRSLPGASQMATSFIYQTLGVAGNRYPQDLAGRQPAGEPIELRDGFGGFLPRLRQHEFGDTDHELLAVEKVHPSAFGFELTTLLASFGEIERKLGRVQPVLLIRDPVAAYRSFVSYQKSAGWHTDVSGDSVAQLFASSLSTMQRLRRLHDGCLIVSYEDLVRDPVAGYTNIADRLGLKTDTMAVSRVLDAAEQWRVQAANSPYFSGSDQPKAAKLVIGSGLLSETERDALEKARITYEELWTDRIL